MKIKSNKEGFPCFCFKLEKILKYPEGQSVGTRRTRINGCMETQEYVCVCVAGVLLSELFNIRVALVFPLGL